MPASGLRPDGQARSLPHQAAGGRLAHNEVRCPAPAAQPVAAGGSLRVLLPVRRTGARRFLLGDALRPAGGAPKRWRHCARSTGSTARCRCATPPGWPPSARGEFGYSLAYHGAVGPLLRQRIPGTLLLTVTATLLAWLLAVPLGVWNAAHARRLGRFGDSKSCFRFCCPYPTYYWQSSFWFWPWKRAGCRPAACTAPGAESWTPRPDFGDTLRHLVDPRRRAGAGNAAGAGAPRPRRHG